MKTKVVDKLSMWSIRSVCCPEDTELLHVDWKEMTNVRTRKKERIHFKYNIIIISDDMRANGPEQICSHEKGKSFKKSLLQWL